MSLAVETYTSTKIYMYIHKKEYDGTETQDEKRPSSCTVQLDENYKKLTPIVNYTIPHPALFPNQGAHESQQLLWDIETQQIWTWARDVD